jgi:hypothetical protein
VSTTQVAPTILAALGLPVNALQAVAQEGTPVLPDGSWTPLRQVAQAQPGTQSLGK